MLDATVSSLLAGSGPVMVLKIAAVAAGFGLGVRLLSAGGGTVDDRDHLLVEAARGHRPTPKPANGADPALPVG